MHHLPEKCSRRPPRLREPTDKEFPCFLHSGAQALGQLNLKRGLGAARQEDKPEVQGLKAIAMLFQPFGLLVNVETQTVFGEAKVIFHWKHPAFGRRSRKGFLQIGDFLFMEGLGKKLIGLRSEINDGNILFRSRQLAVNTRQGGSIGAGPGSQAFKEDQRAEKHGHQESGPDPFEMQEEGIDAKSSQDGKHHHSQGYEPCRITA